MTRQGCIPHLGLVIGPPHEHPGAWGGGELLRLAEDAASRRHVAVPPFKHGPRVNQRDQTRFDALLPRLQPWYQLRDRTRIEGPRGLHVAFANLQRNRVLEGVGGRAVLGREEARQNAAAGGNVAVGGHQPEPGKERPRGERHGYHPHPTHPAFIPTHPPPSF
eukprot:scaffold34138_cov117-Isochrysis_galbana.AAC.1